MRSWLGYLVVLTMTPALAATGLQPAAARRLASVQRLLAQHSGLLIIDGNNVRAATGFRYTACEMSTCLDEWAARSGYAGRMVVVWDHGTAASSFLLQHSSALMSGPKDVQTADDVIVQCCGYLAGACDVAVVTSDKALLGRCRAQWSEATSTSDAQGSIESLHAVYLTWLLESEGGEGWRATDELAERYASPHRCRSESTAHRAAQADFLMQELQRRGLELQRRGLELGPSNLHMLTSWYADGCEGLAVGRVSRSGNPVYALGCTLGGSSFVLADS